MPSAKHVPTPPSIVNYYIGKFDETGNLIDFVTHNASRSPYVCYGADSAQYLIEQFGLDPKIYKVVKGVFHFAGFSTVPNPEDKINMKELKNLAGRLNMKGSEDWGEDR